MKPWTFSDTELARDQEQAAAARLVDDPAAVRCVFDEQMRMHRWLDRVRSEDQDQDPDELGPGGGGVCHPDQPLARAAGANWRRSCSPACLHPTPAARRRLSRPGGPGTDGAICGHGPSSATGVAHREGALPQVVRGRGRGGAAGLREGRGRLTALPLPAAAKHGPPGSGTAGGHGRRGAAGGPPLLRLVPRPARGPARVHEDQEGRRPEGALPGPDGAAADVFACLRTIGRLELYRKNRSLLGWLRALDIYDALKRRIGSWTSRTWRTWRAG